MAENFIRIKQINQSELSGYISSIVATGINVTSTALATGENIVYTTGDQTISGNKTFVNNFSITGSATIANISNGATLQLSGNRVLTTADSVSTTLPNTLLYTSGFQIISGSKTLTGVGVVLNVTTGATLQLSGNRVLTTAEGATIANLASTKYVRQ